MTRKDRLQWRTDIDTTRPGEQPAGFLVHIETTIGPFNDYQTALKYGMDLSEKLKKVKP